MRKRGSWSGSARTPSSLVEAVDRRIIFRKSQAKNEVQVGVTPTIFTSQSKLTTGGQFFELARPDPLSPLKA
jgi:hypothetical protein